MVSGVPAAAAPERRVREKNVTELAVLLRGEMKPKEQSCGIQYLKIFTCAHQTPSHRGRLYTGERKGG